MHRSAGARPTGVAEAEPCAQSRRWPRLDYSARPVPKTARTPAARPVRV